MMKEFNEEKLERIKTMPIFAAKLEYENLKAQIELGLQEEDELNERYLKAYQERLKNGK